MKRCVWILLVAALIGAAYADEKEPPSLSLEEPEEFSFSFDSEPTVLDSKAPKEIVPWLGLWIQETDLLEKALEAEGVRMPTKQACERTISSRIGTTKQSMMPMLSAFGSVPSRLEKKSV